MLPLLPLVLHFFTIFSCLFVVPFFFSCYRLNVPFFAFWCSRIWCLRIRCSRIRCPVFDVPVLNVTEFNVPEFDVPVINVNIFDAAVFDVTIFSENDDPGFKDVCRHWRTTLKKGTTTTNLSFPLLKMNLCWLSISYLQSISSQLPLRCPIRTSAFYFWVVHKWLTAWSSGVNYFVTTVHIT